MTRLGIIGQQSLVELLVSHPPRPAPPRPGGWWRAAPPRPGPRPGGQWPRLGWGGRAGAVECRIET